MVGESGSGKSTKARGLVRVGLKTKLKIARVNRDNLRAMMLDGQWNLKLENLVKKAEVAAVKEGLASGYDMVVDDTNIAEGTQQMWKQVAAEAGATLVMQVMDTPFAECVQRDSLRVGTEQVGRAVIERQFLQSGRAQFDKTAKYVIVDIDGTLANHEGVRSPYDESLVHMDKPYPVVCEWVRMLAHADNGECLECGHTVEQHVPWADIKDEWGCNFMHTSHEGDNQCYCPKYQDVYRVIIVSGRHSTCGTSTVNWLMGNGITFDHIFMRNGGDNRPDTIVKKEILDGILRYIDKEQIAFVIDDRPSVIDMWRGEGLKVFPARGAVEPF